MEDFRYHSEGSVSDQAEEYLEYFNLFSSLGLVSLGVFTGELEFYREEFEAKGGTEKDLSDLIEDIKVDIGI